MSNMIVHPVMAQKISAAINSRSVAANMIDAVIKAEPFVNDDFLYWVNAHREASGLLRTMGIDVLTYEEQTK
jgi:hypothetical protein